MSALADEHDSVEQRLVDRAVNPAYEAATEQATEQVRRILAATFDVMATSQTSDPSLREVLRTAGVSTAAFYRHFRSKDELLLVVLDEGSRIMAGYLEHRMARHDDPVERIVSWVEGMLHQAEVPEAADRTRPFAAGLARVATQFPTEHAQLVGRLAALLEAQIVEGQRQGRCASPDPVHDAQTIFDYTQALTLRHITSRSVPDVATVQHAVGFTLRVIGASRRA